MLFKRLKVVVFGKLLATAFDIGRLLLFHNQQNGNQFQHMNWFVSDPLFRQQGFSLFFFYKPLVCEIHHISNSFKESSDIASQRCENEGRQCQTPSFGWLWVARDFDNLCPSCSSPVVFSAEIHFILLTSFSIQEKNSRFTSMGRWNAASGRNLQYYRASLQSSMQENVEFLMSLELMEIKQLFCPEVYWPSASMRQLH